MSFILDNTSNSNVMLFLIIVLLVFIAITIVYIIHMQIEANNNYHIKSNVSDTPPVVKETPKIKVEDDSLDLQSLTQELSTIPRERVVNLTPYEEEQEEKAIISYDELVNNNYGNTDNHVNEIEDKKDRVVNLFDYSHEEEFLDELKELNKSIN